MCPWSHHPKSTTVSFLFLLVLFKEYTFPLHSYQGAHRGREESRWKISDCPVNMLFTFPQGKNVLDHTLRLICIFHKMSASNLKVLSYLLQSPSFRNNSIPLTTIYFVILLYKKIDSRKISLVSIIRREKK